MTTAEAHLGRTARTGVRPSYRSLLVSRLPRLAEVVVLGLIGLSFLALANLFPYSGDDWAWGSQIGLDRLSTFFADYNGRYAGNLAVLALTRSSALVAVTMAATVAGISLLVLHLARFRTLTGYALVYALLLSMPAEVWRQGIVWTSGFSNYALATLTMLGVLVALRACLERAPGEWRRPALTGVALLLLTFVGQLFIEHVTLYVLGMAVLALLVAARRRRLSLPLWGVVAGALLGAVTMLSNGAYRRAFGGGANTYQKIGSTSGGRTQQMLDAVETAIAPYGVVLNTTLNVVLLILVAVLAVHRARRAEGARRLLFVLAAVVAGLGAVAVVVLVPRTAPAAATVGPVALVALLAALALAALVSDTAGRPLVLVVGFSFVVLVLPLLVVTPLGPRCFVPSYALLLVAVASLAAQAARALGTWWSTAVLVGALVLAASAFVIRFGVYAKIDAASALRQATARTAVERGRSSVTLRHLPGGGLWLHAGDPAFEPWETRYKLFYGLPESLQITVR